MLSVTIRCWYLGPPEHTTNGSMPNPCSKIWINTSLQDSTKIAKSCRIGHTFSTRKSMLDPSLAHLDGEAKQVKVEFSVGCDANAKGDNRDDTPQFCVGGLDLEEHGYRKDYHRSDSFDHLSSRRGVSFDICAAAIVMHYLDDYKQVMRSVSLPTTVWESIIRT